MGDFWSRRGPYSDAEPSGGLDRPPAAAPPHGGYAAPAAQPPGAPVRQEPHRPLAAAPHTGYYGSGSGGRPYPAPAAQYPSGGAPYPSGGAPSGLPAPAPRFPPPSGPPARVGSAVAALLCALATLLCPLLFLLLGFPVLTLLVNAPGIAFGIVALTRTSEPMEVERYIRYTWACILVYLALMAVILIAAIMVILSL